MAERVSQISPEALAAGDPDTRVSQISPEALAAGDPNARVSQLVPEALAAGDPNARVSQAVAEALAAGANNARISQIVLEALVPNIGVFMPIVYPTLPTLSYSVKWRPQFFNMPTQKMATGAELDLGVAAAPLHDFDLTYQVLRDRPAPSPNEFRTMMGFFGAISGNLGRFLFKNPDDNAVQQQAIATTDGTAHQWTLQRTFGVGEYSWTEPVGYVDLTLPFNVYLDGVLQDHTAYTVDTTDPVNQLLDWGSTLGAGQKITADMSYFYYCKLPDDTLEFEQFMYRLWTLNKITLHSCRPNT